jgi:hypothetical protein
LIGSPIPNKLLLSRLFIFQGLRQLAALMVLHLYLRMSSAQRRPFLKKATFALLMATIRLSY